jgi:ribulose-phosphate 3-epimerase
MSKKIQVSASILCADFTRLADEIKKCEDAGVDMLHVDVMDGHFVPNITVGPIIVEAIRPLTSLLIEAHLMIEHPGMYIDSFAGAGSDIISVHAECYGQLRSACRGFGQYPKEVDSIDVDKARGDILRIKGKGKKAFMVLNPGTPVCIHHLFDDLDGVLVMSVNPGFAGQKFMPVAITKIQELRQKFKGDIAVDGGINDLTAPEAVKAGANILATASYFFGSGRPKEIIRSLKGLGP